MSLQDHLNGIELKDCPFCGGKARAYIEDDDVRSLILHISCTNCGVELSGYLASGSSTPLNHEKKEKLIEQWNTRV